MAPVEPAVGRVPQCALAPFDCALARFALAQDCQTAVHSPGLGRNQGGRRSSLPDGGMIALPRFGTVAWREPLIFESAAFFRRGRTRRSAVCGAGPRCPAGRSAVSGRGGRGQPNGMNSANQLVWSECGRSGWLRKGILLALEIRAFTMRIGPVSPAFCG